jgi:hypothetical protein
MYKRRTHFLMAAIGAALSSGAGAIAAAYPDDKLRVRHVDTEQECTFDDRAQLATFLTGVSDPDKWQPLGQLADVHAAPIDLTGSTELAAAIAAADQSTAIVTTAADPATITGASTVTVNLALDQVAAGASPADAITVDVAPAAPIASSDTTPAETPAA